MNSTTLKWLAVATGGLVLLLLVVNISERSDTVSGGEILLPGLKDRINDISEISITGAGQETVTVVREGERWSVREKNGFAANVGKLREVLLALADARRLEQKTANPERFSQLGLEGPDGGSGTLLKIGGENLQYDLIVGNVAQSKNRYVRLADENQTWLIDQNPDLPDGASGWLSTDLLDIDAARIQSVSIRHEDGETIRLEKASQDDANFTVEAIPDGRELTYATVANGIGGVLNDLKLEDVRRSDAGELISTSVYATFDGLELTLRRFSDGDASWFSIAAEFLLPESAEKESDAMDKSDESASDITDDVAIDDTSDESDSAVSPVQEASAIRTQHAGWQYQLPQYKANLLARRWEDILKPEE
ncbi:MAG: DUF4340 domain-containing protein [Gammaproteobacteria bacterium]|nr:DUF4340 domain-containing protein [Gammaproteobacteria bacterium]MDH4314257.1 DUF4340 domain-containing protein [Gammaproteobacteria bacterium]MDH5213642.1 DUF4340 domain-containing protein [Gammaproteobacteria bacterium]